MSTDNLYYLSSEQALADLATFRQFIAKSYNLTDSNKWVSFGGSYPGKILKLKEGFRNFFMNYLNYRLTICLVQIEVSTFSSCGSFLISTNVGYCRF